MNDKYLDNMLTKNIDDIKNGFFYDEESKSYNCLICKESFVDGYIYKHGEDFCDSKKSIELHILDKHNSSFEYLINLDKRYTDLTEQQTNILKLFYDGENDNRISEILGGVSKSNIRNFRALFKKREKQAKVFLAIMELINEREPKNNKSAFFKTDGTLIRIPKKYDDKLKVLNRFMVYFEDNKFYSEKEVNTILSKYYDDYALLRRELVDYGFLKRNDDGTMYNKDNNKTPSKERRKALVEQYNNIKKPVGVFKLTNKANNKIYISTAMDLNVRRTAIFLELSGGNYPFSNLQNDYNKFGKENFEYEILEELDTKDVSQMDIQRLLKNLEKKWMEKLSPYDENGYNFRSKSN